MGDATPPPVVHARARKKDVPAFPSISNLKSKLSKLNQWNPSHTVTSQVQNTPALSAHYTRTVHCGQPQRRGGSVPRNFARHTQAFIHSHLSAASCLTRSSCWSAFRQSSRCCTAPWYTCLVVVATSRVAVSSLQRLLVWQLKRRGGRGEARWWGGGRGHSWWSHLRKRDGTHRSPSAASDAAPSECRHGCFSEFQWPFYDTSASRCFSEVLRAACVLYRSSCSRDRAVLVFLFRREERSPENDERRKQSTMFLREEVHRQSNSVSIG